MGADSRVGRRRTFLAVGVAVILAGAFAGVPTQTALADSFTVNDSRDLAQSAPGCQTSAQTCSLRAAIQAADLLSGASTITLPAGTYSLTIPPTTADPSTGSLKVTSNITIVGAGSPTTIIQNQSNPTDRVLSVFSGASLNLSGVTVQRGNLAGSGGGIANAGTLTLNAVTVTGNSAGGTGGGIDSTGSLTITNSSVSGNSAGTRGGGIASLGGAASLSNTIVNSNALSGPNAIGAGISSDGVNPSLSVTHSVVSGNTGTASSSFAEGGGIADTGSGSSVTISDSTIRLNSIGATASFGRGGGISISGSSVGWQINNSTVNGNTVTGAQAAHGGGIDISGTVVVNATNVTITANSASGSTATDGGGVASRGQDNVNLNFATITDNSAGSGGGLFNAPSAAMNISNSAVSGSFGTCSGSITDGGYNLDSASSCGFTVVNHDIVNTDPNLGPLQDNGGSTRTQAPNAGSPLIDAASPSCPPPATDQRGAPRPFNVVCDIGAVEFGATPPAGGGGGGGPISVLTATGVPVSGRTQTPITATVANFTDSNPTGNPTSYGATINWGDGAVSAGTIFASANGGLVQGTHVYALPGTYTLTVRITKVDGASVTVITTAHIITHYTVEARAYIPQFMVVDPLLPGEPNSAIQAIAEQPLDPNCQPILLSDVGTTSVWSRYIGDDHVPFSGGLPPEYRAQLLIDFDWDGTTITNTVETKREGTTHRLKIYYNEGKVRWCIQQQTTSTDGSHARATGPNSFVMQIAGPAGTNPMIPGAPDFHIDLTGVTSQSDTLSYTYKTTGFPSWGVQVTRNNNGTPAQTNIVNDPSCLSQDDVLDGPGFWNLNKGLRFLTSEGAVTVPATASGVQPSPKPSKLCSSAARAAAGSAATAASALTAAQPAASGSLTRSATAPRLPAGGGTTSSTTGGIAGTVTDTSGKTLGNTCVWLATPFGSTLSEAVTSSKGTYSFSFVAPGAYKVFFEECAGGAHLTQWYNGKPVQSAADLVTVTAGATVTGINGQLGTGGTITGTVTNTSGSPLSGICVHAEDKRGHFADSQATGSSGTYSVGGLPSGNYVVSFIDCPRTDYLTQFYQGASSRADATLVSVTSGANTPNINASLALGGMIKGTVTDSSGAPLNNICVSAISATIGTIPDSANTNTAGTYLLDQLPADKYFVQFSDCHGGSRLSQFWNGRTSMTSADAITVALGATVSGINATLRPGGTITGTIGDGSGAPVSGACAQAASTLDGTTTTSYQPTSSTGVYSISTLPAGSYTVTFSDCSGGNHVASTYPGTVNVTAGGTTSGINGQLLTGGIISGTVTAGGVPVPAICVGVNDASANLVGTAATDPSGNYTVAGLAAGDYKVDFKDCLSGTHVEQWYAGKPDFASASAVHVTVGATIANINAALAFTGSIGGTVTDGAGHPLTDACVSALSVSTGGPGSATTDPTGAYTIAGLSPGSYIVQFSGCTAANAGFVTQWSGGALTAAGATPVSVVVNQTTAGVNASLSTGGSISGAVTDSSGAALANICVAALPIALSSPSPVGTATDAAGHYTLTALPSASYSVQFSDCGGTSHVAQYYNGQSNPGAANLVAVTAPGAITGINGRLASAGSISGLVTDAVTGAALAGICVDTFPAGSTIPTASTLAASDGTYAVSPLPAGAYNVEFTDCVGGGHTTQWAINQASQATANAIQVTAGAVTTGVNAALTH